MGDEFIAFFIFFSQLLQGWVVNMDQGSLIKLLITPSVNSQYELLGVCVPSIDLSHYGPQPVSSGIYGWLLYGSDLLY